MALGGKAVSCHDFLQLAAPAPFRGGAPCWDGVHGLGYVDVVGRVAVACTLSAFTMRMMLPLRLASIVANCFFLTCGALHRACPILALHGVLLPLNSVRVAQILRLRAASGGAMPVDAIRPCLRDKIFHDGDFIKMFHQDHAFGLLVLELVAQRLSGPAAPVAQASCPPPRAARKAAFP